MVGVWREREGGVVPVLGWGGEGNGPDDVNDIFLVKRMSRDNDSV